MTAATKNEWTGGRVDAKTGLLNTDGKDIRTRRKFNNYHMHIEFLLPYKPAGPRPGPGNSGFYQVDDYEVQILDSFGLEGLNNECGGIYTKRASDVNACLPPLQWQTYDVDFTNAVVKDGRKLKTHSWTIRLNGIVIHNSIEIDSKCPGSRSGPEGRPGPIRLQGHDNPLQFRTSGSWRNNPARLPSTFSRFASHRQSPCFPFAAGLLTAPGALAAVEDGLDFFEKKNPASPGGKVLQVPLG